MNKWRRLFLNGLSLVAGLFLVVSYWRDGNYDASWGWGVASLYIFCEVCSSICEVIDART